MMDLQYLVDQVRAKPFVPFTLILSNGDRCEVKTREHISFPPVNEQTAKHNGWIVVYSASAWPRYLALESVISIAHDI